MGMQNLQNKDTAGYSFSIWYCSDVSSAARSTSALAVSTLMYWWYTLPWPAHPGIRSLMLGV